MEFIIILPVFLGMGVATAELATQKGYRARWWLLLGTFIPIFSTIILFTLKNKNKDKPAIVQQPMITHSDKILYQKSV
ncbi:MAG: hypothetical protein KBE91_07940 [Bacteroidia bacterium]|nr:hypothetical protein [Bacteroidia bacterium]